MKTFKFFAIIIACATSLVANAQIGYQVSLLNSATGEPRANETVSVTIDITNSENTSIYQGTQTATTNDFGVLSLQVGNATTFENVDWSKLPLFVSATVDGIMVGRSQILNVPVAEAAKTLVNVDPALICKTWSATPNSDFGTFSITFSHQQTFSIYHTYHGGGGDRVHLGTYQVIGNIILLFMSSSNSNGGLCPSILTYQNGAIHVVIENKHLVLH